MGRCFHCNMIFTEYQWNHRINIQAGEKEYNFHREEQCFNKFHAQQVKRLTLLEATRGNPEDPALD